MKLLKLISVFLFSVFCVTIVAKAETIENNHYTIDTTTRENLMSMFENSNYKNFIISSKRINENNYNYYRYYYLCLTNDELDLTDSMNINSSCDILYTLYNNSISITNNSNLSVINSIYFSSNNNNIYNNKNIFIIIFSIIVLVVSLILYDSFKYLFRSRGGGFKYDDI